MPLLRIDHIEVRYGDALALRNISLSVDKGEIVTVIGSNGAGKTTLIKTVSGLLRPTSGEIEFLSKRIDRLPPDRIVQLGISQIPEGRRLFSYMTVDENLKIGSYFREAKKNRAKTLEAVFELFPILRERKKQLAGTLSGGEQQMLAIGRGLMSTPKLLMLDEPSLGLAPMLVQKTFEIIEEINSRGITVLLVEQNIRYVLSIADKAYVLENGNVVLEGKGEELLHNDFVRKAYLGL